MICNNFFSLQWHEEVVAAIHLHLFEPLQRTAACARPRKQCANRSVLQLYMKPACLGVFIMGFDAFSAEPSNYVDIAQVWFHLAITLAVVVPEDFPGSFEVFPQASNGI